MSGTAAVFIDGGYLDKVLYHDFKRPRIDYAKLVSEICGSDELLRTYYYHCLPHQSKKPTDDEKSRYSSMHRFTTKLSFLPRFEVKLGKLAYRGLDENKKPIFIQKRVDLMVGVDMALLAGKGKITNAILLSGDSDLIPAILAVKREGVLTTLWHGSFSEHTSPSRELFEECDERMQLTKALMKKIKR